jgi:hypothetical protein
MADNQMIKVDFQFDLGNVPASTKAFSNYLKSIGVDLKFTKASTDALASSVGHLATAQTKAAQVGAAAASSVKKSNMQWTNFALVIQDLPYGFRGIQNNLPALMGGVAGMAGPLYLVGSAVIALFTAWDAGLFKTKNATNALNEAQKEYNETLKSSMGSAGEEIAKMNSLVSIAGDQEVSMEKRLSAVKKLQEEYPSYFGNLDKERILNGDVATATDGVKTAIIERAKATAIASKINKLSAEKFAKDEKLYQLALQKTARVQAAVNFVKQFPSSAKDLQGLIDASVGGIRKQENEIKSFVNIIDKELNRLSGLYTDSTKASIGLDDGKGGKTSTPTLQDPNIALLQAKQKYYKDDLLMFASYEQEILAAQRNLAVRQAQIEGKSGKDIQTIKDTYNQLILNSQAETGRKIIEEQSKLGAEQAKEYEKETKEEEKRNKERIARGQKGYEDSLKTVSEFYKNKMNLATGDKDQQIAILKEEQAYFDILYGFNLISYEDYVKKTGEITKQQIGLNNALIKSSAQATLQLGMAIMSALAPAFDMMVEKGASIGEALESVFTNLLKQLAKVIVTAAIAVALMAALGLVDFAAIGSTFKMLVSQGMGLPKMGAGAGGGVSQPLTMFDGFANGGIISGPTYGLMGEYPGAQNNPEVVAPLDKLKDMIGGGGGGTFMLRGQDLLLSVNRAQKASNLKGQNISLV